MFVKLSSASVYCLVVTCWARLTSRLSFVRSNCEFVTGILGQVGHLIVSILDLCPLSYFAGLKVAYRCGL